MNKTDIRRIIKEEISRAITENKPKFKQGEHFKYMGTDHEVIDDNGFIVTAMTKNGNRVKLNHNQLKAINETTSSSDITLSTPISDITPGKYAIDFIGMVGGNLDAEDTTVTEIDQDDINIYKDLTPVNFWKQIAGRTSRTGIYKILDVEKVNESLNEYGVETKQGVYTTSKGKEYPKYRDGERLCIKVRGKKIEIENANGKKRDTQDIERDIRLADIH